MGLWPWKTSDSWNYQKKDDWWTGRSWPNEAIVVLFVDEEGHPSKKCRLTWYSSLKILFYCIFGDINNTDEQNSFNFCSSFTHPSLPTHHSQVQRPRLVAHLRRHLQVRRSNPRLGSAFPEDPGPWFRQEKVEPLLHRVGEAGALPGWGYERGRGDGLRSYLLQKRHWAFAIGGIGHFWGTLNRMRTHCCLPNHPQHVHLDYRWIRQRTAKGQTFG